MRTAAPLALVALLCASAACGDTGSSTFSEGGAGTSANGASSSGGTNDGNAATGSGGFGTGGAGGGNGSNSTQPTSCSPNLTGLVRDFRGQNVAGGHPDFEAFSGNGPTKNLVAPQLGADKKPVFASTTGNGANGRQLTGKVEFDQWYRNTDGVNQAFEYVLPLAAGPNGVATFSSNAFFPVDGKGFGNSGTDLSGNPHNFGFTFELHLQFVYRGGETFTFSGDDDLWVFFNDKLGIDLGGLHAASSASVNLDESAAALGIEKGKVYPLDVFHAERHTAASNFRIDTSLEFVNCDAILLPK